MALLVLPLVFPLGVAPAKREFSFTQEPQKYVIKIVNNEQKDMDVLLSVDGVLRDFITFEEKKISFSKNDYEKSAWYTVTLPADIKPGVSTAKIIAEEIIGQVQHGENVVTAKLVVTSVLSVSVPYPAKYVDATFDILPKEDHVDVTARVVNRGTEDIDQLEATFGIFDGEQQLESQPLAARPLKRGSSDDLLAQFSKENLKPGQYTAKAIIQLDEAKALHLIEEFRLGRPRLEISDFDKYFAENKINPFTIDLESVWNKDITNAYALAYVFQNGKEVTQFKGTSFDVKPWEKKRTTTYFDTNGLAVGEYNAVATLNYDNETSKKEQNVFILTKEEYDQKNKQSNTVTLILLVLVAVFIILLTIALFLLFRARK